MKPCWIIICLFVVSAWRHDLSAFSGLCSRRAVNSKTIIGGRGSSSILCSADDNVFMGFGGKQAHENRNLPGTDDLAQNTISHGRVEDESSIPALPEPKARNPSEPVHSLEVNGDAVSMDELGPIIVNADGTLRRIENWATLTKHEQATTMKLISRRNKKRLTALKELQNEKEKRMRQPKSDEL